MTVTARKTKLLVTACHSVYRGTHPNGHAYTVFEITATRPDGSPINKPLRSWEPLPVSDDPLDVSVVEHDDKSFTLALDYAGPLDRIKALEERMDRLERLEAKWEPRVETDCTAPLSDGEHKAGPWIDDPAGSVKLCERCGETLETRPEG